jgi:hypothetical protein
MIKEMDIRKHVKFLIVRNPLYEIGLKDTIFIRKPSTRKRKLKIYK